MTFNIRIEATIHVVQRFGTMTDASRVFGFGGGVPSPPVSCLHLSFVLFRPLPTVALLPGLPSICTSISYVTVPHLIEAA